LSLFAAAVFGEIGAPLPLPLLAPIEGLAPALVRTAPFAFAVVVDPFVVVCTEEPVDIAGVLPLPPLKGGILWMIMLIFFELAASTGFTVGVEEVVPGEACFWPDDAPGAATTPLEPAAALLGKACVTGFDILTPATATPRDAVAGVDGPMARA